MTRSFQDLSTFNCRICIGWRYHLRNSYRFFNRCNSDFVSGVDSSEVVGLSVELDSSEVVGLSVELDSSEVVGLSVEVGFFRGCGFVSGA